MRCDESGGVICTAALSIKKFLKTNIAAAGV
jgi:hypothetical protein